jgi:large subunit ribosomal protein L10
MNMKASNVTNRTHYPKKKQRLFTAMQELPRQYTVIALSNMNKVRAEQLMMIRKKFHNRIKILIIKNKVAQRAFEKMGNINGIKELSDKLEGPCALMFTNLSPFKLNLIFDKNKVFLAAKGGDIAKKEITIPSGNTGIAPGPVLSEFKEANVATKIDQGTIWISKDSTVVRPGDMISQKTASLLSKLNIKPIEAGIAVNFAVSDGTIFAENDLMINLEEFIADIIKSENQAITLCIESYYVTNQSIVPLIQRAARFGMALATSAGYVSKDTYSTVLSLAHQNASAVLHFASKNGYTTN